jgi:hypothetical protein
LRRSRSIRTTWSLKYSRLRHFRIRSRSRSYWLQQNKNLTGNALVQAVDQQSWDASVKGLTEFPSVLGNMAKSLSWTSELGEAYHNQKAEVMTAIQALRAQAKAAGHLKSTSQMTVVQQAPQTIVIEPANPQVVYVPQYNPAVIYGYPYVTPGYTGRRCRPRECALFWCRRSRWCVHGWRMGMECVGMRLARWRRCCTTTVPSTAIALARWLRGWIPSLWLRTAGTTPTVLQPQRVQPNVSGNQFNRNVSGNTVNINRAGAFSDNHFSDANSWAQHNNFAGRSNAFSGLDAHSGGFGGWSSRADSARGWGSMRSSGFSGFHSFSGFHGGGGFRGGGRR